MHIPSLFKRRSNYGFEIPAGTLKKFRHLLRCEAVFFGKDELEGAGISERYIITIYG
jgi:hypothetical protein